MFYKASAFNQVLCGPAWVNSEANQDDMFVQSGGSIASESEICETNDDSESTTEIEGELEQPDG